MEKSFTKTGQDLIERPVEEGHPVECVTAISQEPATATRFTEEPFVTR